MGKKAKRAATKPKRKVAAPAPAGTTQTYYDSIAQASVALNTPVQDLRRYKREGAPGFRGSRVYPAELIPWLKEREKFFSDRGEPENKEALECRKLRAQCERIEFQNSVIKGEYTRNEVFISELGSLAGGLNTLLQQKENELPPLIAGQEPAVIRVFLKRLFDDMRTRMQGLVDKWAI